MSGDSLIPINAPTESTSELNSMASTTESEGAQSLSIDSPPNESTAEFRRTSVQMHIGPMPPPELLVEYAKINPELPIRMMKMAERAMAHECAMDRKKINIAEDDMKCGWGAVRRGQFCALSIGLGCLVAALVAIKISPSSGAWMGTFLGAGGIATLVSAFLFDQRKQRSDPPHKELPKANPEITPTPPVKRSN